MGAVLFVNYKGRPWMKVLPEVNAAIHLSPFPDDQFRFEIVGLVLASLFGTLLWDRFCTLVFAPRIFRAQLEEFKKITLADLEPILVTLLKVLGVMFVLSTGNLLFYGAAFYLYRQHKKRAAHEEKLAKQKIITGEAPPIEAAD